MPYGMWPSREKTTINLIVAKYNGETSIEEFLVFCTANTRYMYILVYLTHDCGIYPSFSLSLSLSLPPSLSPSPSLPPSLSPPVDTHKEHTSGGRFRREKQSVLTPLHHSSPSQSYTAGGGGRGGEVMGVCVSALGIVGILVALAMCAHSSQVYNTEKPNAE